MEHAPSETRQPKQARAIRTRERILDQAEVAFAAKGFEAASLTSDILEPAGISVGSFYHQFSDKRAVLYALLEERRAWRFGRATAEALSDDRTSLDDAIRRGVTVMLDDIDVNPATWWIHFRELHNSDLEIRRMIEQNWSNWIRALQKVVARWSDDPQAPSFDRVAFATFGLTGLMRMYLDGDPATRRHVREHGLDEAVLACVAGLRAVGPRVG